MMPLPTSLRISGKIEAESPSLRTQIQREQWEARQGIKRRRSALAGALSRCSGAGLFIAAVASEADASMIGRNTLTNTALGRQVRPFHVEVR